MNIEKEGYNGWRNYTTWRVNLELFSDMDFTGERFESVYALSEYLKNYVYEFIEGVRDDNDFLVSGWASAFVSEVDFYEITQAIVRDNPEIIK